MSEEAELPERPRIPDPPQARYTRPKKGSDPVQRYLDQRGIGASNAGQAGQAMSLGTALVGSILGGVLLGWLADRYLLHPKETPWGLIVGFVLGCISGFANLLKLAGRIR
jgi:F0F1-type ATP synthase assembly protein I